MKINREELLNQLESVQPGLSIREIIEQSSCFVFQDGKVITYNDEIFCSQKTPLKIKGAVLAAPLIALLRKMVETEVDIELLLVLIDETEELEVEALLVLIDETEEILVLIEDVEVDEVEVLDHEEELIELVEIEEDEADEDSE